MSGIAKWIIGAVLVIFALIGIKSLFAPNPAEAPPSASGWEQPLVMPNANLPSPDAIGDSAIFTRPLNDKPAPAEEEDNTVELVGEPEDTDTVEAPKPPPTRTPPKPAEPLADEPDTDTAPVIAEPTETPKPATPPPAPVVGKTGTLEIVAQTETGKPIKANVYVQQANGVNLDNATYTNKAAFTLKPGKYKITVRAEGYASLSRTISVPDGAVVNEIFPLPALVAAAPAPVAAPPRQPEPVRPAPAPAPSAAQGRLRVVALSADDGTPIPVNFTIARLDGSVVERVNNVSLTELSLPAQEFVVSFDYQGFHGYKSLTVPPGQVFTHTFNIRGVSGQAQVPQELPPQQPMQQPPPQTVEEMLMQRLQDELQKRLTN
ncbi:PEGA domain-containing protein [Thiothrix subterranea]|uniref:PEGA domain-containing protein n=1 Tax=Thiothrix subterranea TaxID=2735563 RepID=UPI00192B74E8|nr:PEGA domain-containing protein [Thiothrix subterranea]QQZ29778.1 PEGA domain-containing protein [Thiothrix subterranea]